jgi:hypothetical protein
MSLGVRRGHSSFCFNDRSDDDLTDNEMLYMRQVIEGEPSATEHAAAEVARSLAAASGDPHEALPPITWPTWPLEEDLMYLGYKATCKEQGKEINPLHWWHTCELTDLHLRWAMAGMPANRESHSQEEHGIYRHIKRAWETAVKIRCGQGLEPTIMLDAATPADIQAVITIW